MLHLPTLAVDQRELHPAKLRTLPTVGTPPKTMLGSITDARIADTEGTMYKHLEFDIGHLAMDLRNLLDGEFTSQDHP